MKITVYECIMRKDQQNGYVYAQARLYLMDPAWSEKNVGPGPLNIF